MSHQHYSLSIPPQSQSSGATKLRNAASARYGGDWSSIPHAHSYTELFYVIDGDGQFRIDGELFPVRKDQLIVVNPHIVHTEVSYDDHPLEYIVVGIEGPELQMHEEHDGRFCILTIPKENPVLNCMQAILKEMQQRQTNYETVCQAYTEILLIHLLRTNRFTVAETTTAAQGSHLCASIHHYIDNHYKEHLTLESLAVVGKVNKYYLAHAFCKEYGMPPMKYMQECRINEGKRLLEETDHSLSQLATILGFSSASYFSQAFHRVTGISPIDYRRQHKK